MPMLAESSTTTAIVGSPVRLSDRVNSAIINTTMATSAKRMATSSPRIARPVAVPSRA